MPATTQPFVWDAFTSITGFPSEHYEISTCAETPVRAAGDLGPAVDVGPPPYPDVDSMRSKVGVVFVATVDEVRPAFTATAINLPAEYLAATGLRSGVDIAVPWTPTTMTVDTLVWGEADATVAMGELGCFAQGATAAVTPGATLLVLAEQIEPGYGPFTMFGGTHLIVDWFAVDESLHLTPRVGVTGTPPSAPFLSGLELSEALILLDGA